MKAVFLSNAPHPAHGLWADSINAEYLDDRVNAYKLKNLSRLLKSFKTLRRIKRNADFVLCESASQLPTGVLWKLKNKKKKLGLIVSDPKYYHIWRMLTIKKKLYLWMLKKIDVLVCTSEMMKNYLPVECQKRAFIVAPAFDRKSLKRVKGNVNTKNIIFTARICLEKGVDHLVEAFLKVKKEFPEAKLYLCGASSYIHGQGNLREQLERRNLKDVIFTGHVDIKPYLRLCSLYVNLSWIDPASVSVIQAMSVGIVPIVSKGVGNKVYVERVAKELVVKDDAEAERIIKKLWKSKVLLKKYAKKAIEVSGSYPSEEESVRLFKEGLRRFI
ncbi:MAG TPA: glycosyltransferase family 4 protein [Candidatus Nanoarchaeia archaeon]|nr:glycosyltransferase family 4 protein [Candidatus Nanoarchaeia archaeon]